MRGASESRCASARGVYATTTKAASTNIGHSDQSLFKARFLDDHLDYARAPWVPWTQRRAASLGMLRYRLTDRFDGRNPGTRLAPNGSDVPHRRRPCEWADRYPARMAI